MSCPSCEPWLVPPDCCKKPCDSETGQALFDLWWPAVCEWVNVATCNKFGCCDVEYEPCPPRCVCPNKCGCGPWQTINLRNAWGSCPIKLEDGKPQIEFRFPQPDGTTDIYGWEPGGIFKIRPDMWTIDWCEPLQTCGGWPAQTDCYRPWTIAAKIGREPPKMLVYAAGQFTCEIVKSCMGEENCLPDGVRSITRRGLSMDVDQGSSLDEATINFDTKNTGVPLLDMALREFGCETPNFAFVDPMKYRDLLNCTSNYEDDNCWSFRAVWPATPVGQLVQP